MLSELRKLLHKRWMILVSVLLFSIFSVSYISELFTTDNGNDFSTIREYYEDPDYFLSIYEDFPLLSDIPSAEEETVIRMKQQKYYSENIKNLIGENELKITIGLVKSDVEINSIHQTDMLYQKISNTDVPIRFHGGIEKYLSSFYPCLVGVLTAVLCCFVFFLQERKESVYLLINAAEKGHRTLYQHQISAVLTFSLLSFLLMSGIQLTVATALGIGSLNDPIQSVYGMWMFPYSLSIVGYLILHLVVSGLLLAGFDCLLILLCSLLQTEWKTLPAMALIGTGSILTYNSSVQWLRSFNLFRLFQVNGWLNTVIHLNIFGIQISRFPVICAAAVILISLAYFFGYLLIAREAYRKKKHGFTLTLQRMHTGKTVNEIIKYWMIHGGAVSVIITACFVFVSYDSLHLQLSEPEMFYRKYAEVLKGEKTEEKELYLINEEIYLSEDTTGNLNSRQLGFNMAKQQYESLSEDEVFADRLSHMWISGHDGFRTLSTAFLLLLIGISYTVSSAYACEYETGVCILQKSYAEEKHVKRIRSICALTHILLLWTIIFIPLYMKIAAVYGITDLAVKAGSIPYGLYLFLYEAIHILIAVFFTVLCSFLARKLKVRNYVLVICILILTVASVLIL